MATFRTGRTITLTWSAALSGDYAAAAYNPHTLCHALLKDPHPNYDATFSLTAYGLATVNVTRYLSVTGTGPGTLHVGTHSILGLLGGSSTVDTYDSAAVPANPCTGVGLGYPITGTFSGSIECEECIEITFAGFYNNVPDPPLSTGLRVFLRTRYGGSYSASCCGASVSGTIDATHVIEVTSYSLAADIDGSASGGNTTFSVGTPSFSLGGTTSPTFSHSASQSYGIEPLSASASISSPCSMALTCDTLTINTDPGPAVGTITQVWGINKSVSLSGTIYTAAGGSYPDSLTVNVAGFPGVSTVTGSGSFSASATQHYYGVGGTAMGSSFTGPSASEYSGISAAIDAASLATNGEDANATTAPKITRLLIKGRTFDALSLSQASSVALSPSWASSGSGRIQTGTFSGGTGGVSLEQGASSYRYLRVVLRSVGAGALPGTITIPASSTGVCQSTGLGNLETDVYSGAGQPSKSWDFTTGADSVYVTIDIDLCAPQSLGAATSTGAVADTQDTLWPYPPRSEATMGVPRIPEIVAALTGTPSATLEVSSVTLIRKGATIMTAMGTWHPYVYDAVTPSMEAEWPLKSGPDREISGDGTMTESLVRRGFLWITDGHQGTEEEDFSYQKTTGGVTGTVTYGFNVQSIAGLAANLASAGTSVPGSVPKNSIDNQYNAGGTVIIGAVRRHPGWSATTSIPAPGGSYTPTYTGDLPPAHDWYYNDALPAVGIGPLFDQDITSGASLTAVPYYDSIDFYPGYDYAEGGNQCVAVLRGAAHGVCLTPDALHVPRAGAMLQLIQTSDSSVRGTATTDAFGSYYVTGNPAGRAGGVGHEVKLLAGTDPTGTPDAGADDGLPARHRARVWFYCPPAENPAHGPCCLNTERGGFFALAYEEGGVIRFTRTQGQQVPRSSTDFILPIDVTAPTSPQVDGEPRLFFTAFDHRLRLLFTRWDDNTFASGVVMEQESTDSGATWTAPVMVSP